MPTSPENLRLALIREREELFSFIDPRLSRFGRDSNKSNLGIKRELEVIAKNCYDASGKLEPGASTALKQYATSFADKLAELPRDDREHLTLCNQSLALERVFIAAFAVQHLGWQSATR